MEMKLTNGMTLKIEREEYCENPREMFDNLWTWISNAPRYFRSDKNADDDVYRAYFDGDEDDKETLEKNYLVVPIYAYIHSGTTISLTPFSCPWDSGTGFIAYLSRKKMEKEGLTEEDAVRILEGEVKEYDSALQGDVFYFCIENEDGDIEDSCGGFYGFDGLKSELEGNSLISEDDFNDIKCLKDWDI